MYEYYGRIIPLLLEFGPFLFSLEKIFVANLDRI